MDDRLQQKVRESGHNLHLNVANFLKEEDWKVELASYYIDDLSDKPREIDIIAEMPVRKGSPLDGTMEEVLKTRLFIECKYFKTPIALRTLPVDISEAHQAIVAHNINDVGEIFLDWHHYVGPRATKLWTTLEDRGDQFFDGLASSAKSLLYYLGTRASRGLYYPVLVYDGIEGMYEIEGNDLTDLKNAPLVKRALVSFNYAYTEIFTNKPRRRHLFIDVVHREELPALIKQVVNEGNKVKNRL